MDDSSSEATIPSSRKKTLNPLAPEWYPRNRAIETQWSFCLMCSMWFPFYLGPMYPIIDRGACSSGTISNTHAPRNRETEAERCLYLTFSKWAPLTEGEIIWYFDQMFGRCVQTVVMYRGVEGSSLSARVIFESSYIPRWVLGKENQAHFMVNGKPICCKKYIPKKKKNQDQESLITME